MVKALYLLVFSAVVFQHHAQTISQFENWVPVQTWEEPVNCSTNNFPSFISVSKSTDAHSGNYSAQVISNGPSFEGPEPGVLRTTFYPTTVFSSVYYYLKIDSLYDVGSVEVNLKGYNNGTVIFMNTVSYTNEIPYFQLFNMPTLNTTSQNTDSVTLEFIAKTVSNGASYQGYADFKVDDISLDNSLRISENESIQIKMYPNPSKGKVYITSPQIVDEVAVYSSDGKWLKAIYGNCTEIDLSTFERGIYFLRISAKGQIQIERVVRE